MPRPLRTRVAHVLLLLAIIAAALAAWALLTGGIRTHVFGVRVSLRGAARPALVAIVFVAAALALHQPFRRRLIAGMRAVPLSRLPVAVVWIAAAGVLWTGFAFGSRAAGGSDSYGYVTQVALWRRGDLHIRQDFAASVPWPNADWTLTPLGYRPSPREPHTIVPTYPPGLPLLMLASTALAGSNGVYYLTPICGALLVLLTFALGVRLSNPLVGSLAALCLVVSPAFLFMLMLPMGDVPVAAGWMASLLFALAAGVPRAAASGIASGMAIAIRPNLVPLALVPLLLSAWQGMKSTGGSPRREAIRHAAAFSLACAPFCLFIGIVFSHLYGSPLRSGYGENATLFAWENVAGNLSKYSGWLWESQGLVPFLFPVSAILAWRRPADFRVRVALTAFVGMLAVIYVFYLPFDDWWYLRFLLPAFPLVFVLVADAMWAAVSRRGVLTRVVAVAIFAALAIGPAVRVALQRDVLWVGRAERRYVDVGQLVVRLLPPNAIVLAMQHSGTVRYYTGANTIRYDFLDPEWLDRGVEHLIRSGYEPYLIVDEWELPMFRERFASQKLATITRDVPEEPCTHATLVYRLRDEEGKRWSARIPQISGCW